ncbi:MAG: hypothetical protein Q4G63_11190 [Bacteroidia bacterium]|nr:hypothetical protein [Bacteroidia bacterium]
MKNKISLLLMLIFILTSCMNKEKKAEKLIKENMFESLYDFSSYEPVKIEKIDSAFSTPETDSIIYSNAVKFKYVFDEREKIEKEIEDALSDMRLWSDSYGYYGRNRFNDAKDLAEKNLKNTKCTIQL